MVLPSLGHLLWNHSYYYQTIFFNQVLFVLIHSRDGLIVRLVDSTLHVFKGPQMLDFINPMCQTFELKDIAGIPQGKHSFALQLSSKWVGILFRESNRYKCKKNEWFGPSYV